MAVGTHSVTKDEYDYSGNERNWYSWPVWPFKLGDDIFDYQIKALLGNLRATILKRRKLHLPLDLCSQPISSWLRTTKDHQHCKKSNRKEKFRFELIELVKRAKVGIEYATRKNEFLLPRSHQRLEAFPKNEASEFISPTYLNTL
jgi:hypothetical protein